MSINLLPHQINTIEYLEKKCINQKGLLIYHYLGTGKTITGLGWLYHILKIDKQAKYLIVCPEIIKNSWITNSEKLNIKLNLNRLINYNDLTRMIQIKDKKIEHNYLILDEVHNLIKIIRELISSTLHYSDINNYLTKTKKNLLLSGTPFNKNIYDISILINLCTNEPFMPIDIISFKEKFLNTSDIDKNKKNKKFFNYIMPFMETQGISVFKFVDPLIYNIFGNRPNIFNFFTKIYGMYISSLIIDNIKIDKYIKILNSYFGQYVDLNSLISFLKNNDNSLDTESNDQDIDSYDLDKDYNNIDYNKYYSNQISRNKEIAKNIIIFVGKQLLSMVVWKITDFIWDKLMENFNYNPVDSYDLKFHNDFDYNKLIDETNKYISYYKYIDNKDYATIKDNLEYPKITLLSINSIFLSIQFYLGKVDKKILSFITDRSLVDLKLDSTLINNEDGIELYGRCISNLPDFISELVNYNNNFNIDLKYGTINLNNFSKNIIKSKSSTKIKELGNYLSKQNKKIVVYSDYIEQGIYFLSSYLNSIDLKHLYLNKKLNLKSRIEINDYYNNSNEIKIILIDKESREGISLLNVEEIHFLEPPIDLEVKDQVIGRAIRYQSHLSLPNKRKKVNIFYHLSTLFHNNHETIEFFNKLNENNFFITLMNPIRNIKIIINHIKDDWYIKNIIHKIKKDEFEGQLQTTFHYLIDEFLGKNIEYSVQGIYIYGNKKSYNNLNSDENLKKKHKNKNGFLSVLSVDEICFEKQLVSSIKSTNFIKYLEEKSILSNNFSLDKNCHQRKITIKRHFKSLLKKTISKKN